MAQAAIAQARLSTISESTTSSNPQLQRRSQALQSQQFTTQQRSLDETDDVQVVLAPRVPALHVQHRRKTLRARLTYLSAQWGTIYQMLFTAFPYFGVLMVLDLLLAIGAFIAATVPATLDYYANSGGCVRHKLKIIFVCTTSKFAIQQN